MKSVEACLESDASASAQDVLGRMDFPGMAGVEALDGREYGSLGIDPGMSLEDGGPDFRILVLFQICLLYTSPSPRDS